MKELDVGGGLFVRNFVQHQRHRELGEGSDGIHTQNDSGNPLVQVQVGAHNSGNGSG